MSKYLFFALLFLAACSSEPTANHVPIPADFEAELHPSGLDYKNLKLYPIIASSAFLAELPPLAHFKNMQEALDTKGFRLTEKVAHAGNLQAGEVNLLTVHNKTQDTIYLMTGEVLQGGKQDRIIAEDLIVMPRTLKDIPVFCVEKNRWEYQKSETNAKNLPIRQAFTAYYHVAANDLRKTVKRKADQEQVWTKVSELMARNNATSTTGTYAALEQSAEFTEQRTAYLEFFLDRFDHSSKVIGCIAVSGNDIIGTDIFGHPELFKKQYKSLIYSYITDAISNSSTEPLAEEKLERYIKRMQKDYYLQHRPHREKEMKFRYRGDLVHFTHF